MKKLITILTLLIAFGSCTQKTVQPAQPTPPQAHSDNAATATTAGKLTATGTLGEIRVTSAYIYVCTATNVWVRSALTTW